MKIGIAALGFEVEEHIDKVLMPWMGRPNVVISCVNGIFPEVAALGYSPQPRDKTLEKFGKLCQTRNIHHCEVAKEPMYEKDLRNLSVEYLKTQNIDLLWLLDLQDEVYSRADIDNILLFIEQNPYIDYFKVNFKNYAFDNNTYINDFCPPRIWRTNRHGGVKEFYYDNDIMYESGIQASFASSLPIPRGVAFINHYSWVGSPDYLKRKIEFQHKHYGHCGYKWNTELNILEFDKEYYSKYNLPIPILYKDKKVK